MWLSDTAVRRPIMATVASILMVVFGLVALFNITVREYPDIDPPVVSIRTAYPGASAAIMESRVTQVLEDQIAGIEGIREITSRSREGRSDINIEFRLNRDIEAATNDVRDRVSRAARDLPSEADPPVVAKADSDATPVIWLVLSSDRMDQIALSDYAERFLADRFSALDGVASINYGGQRQPAIRIWLDRNALVARGLTVNDVEAAMRAQNVERPAGRLESLTREFTLRTQRPFDSPESFARLVIATSADGYPIRLGDVATVNAGTNNDRSLFNANGVPTVGLGIVKQSSANTLSVAQAVKAEAALINQSLPDGMQLLTSSDFSLFIEASLNEITTTLVVAGILVILVIWLFIGDLRATLIPALTVPISIIATFIFLYAFGFSINVLTLLALVLAIGLVVDDTIVLVENIHRRLVEGEPPLVAAFNGAREVGFAILATTLVLMAVFAPLAFLDGTLGRLFREFSLSLAAAVVCSMFVALTLSPVLASLLLSRDHKGDRLGRAVSSGVNWLGAGYRRLLVHVVRHAWAGLVALALLLGVVVLMFMTLPREFTPPEDRGQFFINVTAPEGATLAYTTRYMQEIERRMLARMPEGEIDRFLTRIPGFGAADEVSSGNVNALLTDWRQRSRPAAELASEITEELSDLPGVSAAAFQRGAFGIGFGQPVSFVLGGSTYEELADWRDRVITRLNERFPGLHGLDSDFRQTKPQMEIDIDINRAGALGVPLIDISTALETLFGGRRVTTYTDRGQEYDVWMQAGLDDRRAPSDLNGTYVRSASGTLVPLANLITTRESASAQSFNRFNRMRSITISGSLAPGVTLGEALDAIEEAVAEELPPTARLSWTGDSRNFKDSSHALYIAFGMALLVVFLVLAAQFESFIHPVVIMSTVPLAVFGALLALLAQGFTLNIYSQIGIIMLVGLAAKNGILIVEFANQRRDAGLPFHEALIDAAAIRFRPILMTSVSTIAGVVPLYIATGAGAEARQMLGVVVFWGVFFSAALTLFLVPAFYALLCRRAGSPGRAAAKLASQQARLGASRANGAGQA